MEKDVTNGQDSPNKAKKRNKAIKLRRKERPSAKDEPVLKRWLDNQDLMIEFYVCERTLFNWRQKELIPFGSIGRKIYYDRRLIEGLLNKDN